MTEKESIQRAFMHLHASDDTLTEVMSRIDKESSAKRVNRASKLTLRAVLIAALIAALSVITALAVSEGGFLQIIQNEFNVRDLAPDAEIVPMQDMETGETLYFANSDSLNIIVDDEDGNTIWHTISFSSDGSEPAELGDWKLGTLPEGFQEVESSRTSRSGEIHYAAHRKGKTFNENLDFSYELPGSKITFYQPFTVEKVMVGEDEGVLVKSPFFSTDHFQSQHFFWFSSDAGVVFTLFFFGDPEPDQIDLIELALSVEPN